MKIALVGYGKMGKAIEQIAISKGHEIVLKISFENREDLTVSNLQKADIAIEFSTPETALQNIKACFEAGVPVVVGTTGWLDELEELKNNNPNCGLFFASNYSIGMNITFALNEYLAKIMKEGESYGVSIDEWHHIHKLDAPSGTAITLAEGIIENTNQTNWKLNKSTDDAFAINAFREGEIPGTHIVKYDSEIDSIEIKHTAHSREGFAKGAVVAAEWMQGKTGFYGMKDLLNL